MPTPPLTRRRRSRPEREDQRRHVRNLLSERSAETTASPPVFRLFRPMRVVHHSLDVRFSSFIQTSVGRRIAVLAFISLLALAAVGAGQVYGSKRAARTPRPLVTGIVDPWVFSGPDTPLALSRVRSAGAGVVRLFLSWRGVAPATEPAGFRPANPGDAHYNWGALDRVVKLVHAHGLEPL